MMERHKNARIDAVAAEWVARCDRGPLPPDERARLDAWLAEDRRHLGAWARANAVYARFDRARALGPDFDDRHARSRREPANPARRRFLWLGGAAAAGLAAFALLRQPGRRIATRLGEVLRVPLEDGSSVTLNSDSLVRLRFDETRRLVQLLRGEAWFDVARDGARPFVVDAAGSSVTAVGTHFSVRRGAGRAVEVMVSEGVVLFAPSDSPRPPLRLAADTLAVADVDAPVQTLRLRPVDVRRRLAWRDGMLSFDGDTLVAAAAQFARYSDLRIVIRDPAVAGRRVVGRYSATDPAGFAQAVALSMHLRFERRGDAVFLFPASAPLARRTLPSSTSLR